MNKSEIKTISKIIAGYVIVIILTALLGWLLYITFVRFTDNNNKEPLVAYKKSIIINNFILALYENESYAMQYNSENYSQYYSDYTKNLSKINLSLDSMRYIFDAPDQLILINRLDTLLNERKKNNIKIRELSNKLIKDKSIENNINRIIDKSSTITSVLDSTYNDISTDTVKVEYQKKKGFFRRLKEAFVSPKENEYKNVVIEKVNEKRSTHIVPANDTLVVELHKMKENITEKNIEKNTKIQKQLSLLQSNSHSIGLQINKLINELNQETNTQILNNISQQRSNISAFRTLTVTTTIIAFLVVLSLIIAILRDISKNSKYRKELEVATKRAEDLMKSRQRMLLNISHDIKAPICSISGYLDILKNEQNIGFHNEISAMKISANYILNLLSTLLEYARIESGETTINLSEFYLSGIMNEIEEIFRPIAIEKNLRFNIETSHIDSTKYIEADKMRLRQVIMNLVSNAIKFTDKGYVTLSYSINDASNLVISVEDTGIGINDEDKDVILNEFGRGSNVDENGYEGSGLGLSVVSGILSMFRGYLSIDSTAGKGSKFTATIPIIVKEQKTEVINTMITPLKNILIIDDDKIQLAVCANMLSHMGHKVTTISPQELELFRNKMNFDLIISDLQMGNYSGFQLIRSLREEGCDIACIAISAKEYCDLENLKEAGFEGFINKPLTINKLNEAINAIQSKLDPFSLIQMMGNDMDAVNEIISIFISGTFENLESLKKLQKENNYTEARKLCHRMLPMFLQFDIKSIATILKNIDASGCDNHSLSTLIDRLEAFMSRYHKV